MKKSKLLCVITFILFVLPAKAQDGTDYTWIPLKSLEVSQFHYNTNIPIYAVGVKKVEGAGLPLLTSMFFSEKPNEIQEGYYAVNTSRLTISVGDKNNTIQFDQLQDIGDGWKGMNFKKPLYILKGESNVRLQNMKVYISKKDYAKMAGGNLSSSSLFRQTQSYTNYINTYFIFYTYLSQVKKRLRFL